MEDQAFPIQYQANCPYFRTRLFLQPILKIPSHSKTLCAFGTSTREKRSAGNCSFIPKQGVYTTERSLSLSLSSIPAAFEREFRVSFAPGRFLLHAIDNRQLPRHDSALRTPLNKLSTYFPWHRVRRLIEHERENTWFRGPVQRNSKP